MASTSSADSRSEPSPVERVEAAVGELRTLEALLRELPADALPEEVAQRLLTLGARLYYAQREAGADFGPFLDGHDVSATEAMVAASNMLQAVDVEVFELGFWKTLTGG